MKQVSNFDHLYHSISNAIVYLLKRNVKPFRGFGAEDQHLEADNQKRGCPIKVNDKF